VGVVVRTPHGAVLHWHAARVRAHTCNEAEYQALIVGLTLVRRHYPAAHICCLSDSQVVIDQMCGRAAVRAGALQPLHTEARVLAKQCRRITFLLIPRELNRLADALAWEALGGQRSIGAVGQAWVHDGFAQPRR
jgi:ribonuclease HI